MKSRKNNKIPSWNLSDIFKSINDPQITRSIKKCKLAATSFQKRYRGKLSQKLVNNKAVYDCLTEYERINQELSKPTSYASLIFSADQSLSENGAFLQKMRSNWAEVQKLLVFFELELVELPSARLQKWISSKTLARYSNYLAILINNKKHLLDENREKLLTDLDLTGRSAFVRLFSEEQSARRYTIRVSGKVRECSESQALDYMLSSKRSERELAFHSISNVLKRDARRTAYIFNTLLEDKRIKDDYRAYRSPEESRHQANQISQSVVDGMTKVVVGNYKLVQEYYTFKASRLKLKKLSYWDRSAPLGKLRLKFTFEQARTIVLDAFHRFSAEYAGIAEEFFERGWIDAELRSGKRSGAYCSFMTPDLHPLVFMNFNGSLRDVFTLAHELGHAVHARLMSGTSYLNYNMPLTIAEVASTFAELLVFEHLQELLPSEISKFALYANKIDNIIATVFRQISMYKFEQSFHNARRVKGEQSVDQINELWLATQAECFKGSVQLNNGAEYWWSYIPHFIHTPFYVYAYAFGDLMALSLFQQYKSRATGFVSSYMHMLALGNSQNPQQLVKGMGISLSSNNFWKGGMEVFKELLKKTKEMS